MITISSTERPMKRFKIEQSETEIFTSNSGLALVGQVLHQFTSNPKALPNKNARMPLPIAIWFYLGLLYLGKNDFDAVEKFRQDEWFAQSLDVSMSLQPPSFVNALMSKLTSSSRRLTPRIWSCCKMLRFH